MGLPARELVGYKDYARLADKKENGSETYGCSAMFACRGSSPWRLGSLVWKRKAEEAGCSMGTGGEKIVLIGSIPCQLLAGDVQSGEHESGYSKEEGALYTSRGMCGEGAKQPRLVSAEGREIMGPGFFAEPRECVVQLGGETREAIRSPGPAKKTTAPGTTPGPCWYPPGLTRMQRQRVQKLRTKEISEKAQETERDHWFNQERPTREPAKMRKEKRIEREGRSEESGDDEGNTKEVGTVSMEVSMAFHLPDEFGLPETELVQLDLGAERAIFEKPEEVGSHMKSLYIKGYLDGEPVGRMLVDGGACVNIMPCSVFERLGHQEKELMRTNMTLSGFSGEVSDTKGIISKELTVGNKTIPTAFCVVDIKGKYNVLLGWDWIHANGCVPSTLHQCVMR
jgi:hypothetical protein